MIKFASAIHFAESIVAPNYRVVFLTGPPNFQYKNEKQEAANQD